MCFYGKIRINAASNGGVKLSEVFKQKETTYLHIEKWKQLNADIIAGFTMRNGGISKPPFHSLNTGLHVKDVTLDVVENRKIIASEIGVPLSNWVCAEQTHQTNVHFVTDLDKGKGAMDYSSSIKATDGLITNKPGILCTAVFADCVPLFFYDPITSSIGIAHAGWKGTVNKMASQMVQAFKAEGVEPSDLLVAVGPCISKDYYEVDQRVVRHIPKYYWEKVVFPKENNRFLFDMKQLHVEILLQAGVLRNNIEVTEYCTYRDETLFFSHRRDHGETGRMLGFIGLLP